jgi:tetratricopeptide (TPR) repeat protein
MLPRISAIAAVVASGLLGATALGDDAEIMAHYKAYDDAFAASRFPDAATEGEAAWRAAEKTWGARNETGMLAFNLARIELLLDQRGAAVEPAERALALIDQGVAKSVPRDEAAALAAFARFDAKNPSHDQLVALASALAAFSPGDDPISRRIDARAWLALVRARADREDWPQAIEAADRATQLLAHAPSAEPAVYGSIAMIGAQCALRRGEDVKALDLVHRGVAAFPAQPRERPVDNVLGLLLGWDAGLHNAIAQRRGDKMSLTAEERKAKDDAEPSAWRSGRYPTEMGCKLEWINQPPASYPPSAALNHQTIGQALEIYLDADGSIARIDPLGPKDDAGFMDAVTVAMRKWRAASQPRAECRGPWLLQYETRITTRVEVVH